MISAAVVCHSQAPNGEQLLTLEVEFHRFILAEVNTHRVLSRNYQSSRAVPVEKMIKQVRENPAIPVHWGKNQRGMVAEEELDAKLGEARWRRAAHEAANQAQELNNLGYHKQIVNRVLEPFIWTKGVITATLEGWQSVLDLRLCKDSQPEFRVLAEKIKGAISNSNPVQLNWDDYHLPYVEWSKDEEEILTFTDPDITTIEQAVKVSCSSCAQVSYRVLDTSLEKAIKVYDMLNLPKKGVFKEDPAHFSPAEHVALVREGRHFQGEFTGNFVTKTFQQYRKLLEHGIEDYYL
jgi:hypothetical protein